MLRSVMATCILAGLQVSVVMAQDEAADPAADPAAEGEPALEAPKSFWDGWQTTASIGLNGSTGNTERFNFRAGLNTERLTDHMESRGSLVYSLGIDESETTENKFQALARNDWLIPASPWRYFARASAEFDDFQEWDWLLTANGGIGYEFINDEEFLLIGRTGLGVSQKVGGEVSGERFRVEWLVGGDFVWTISDTQNLFVTADYFQALNEWPQYRITSRGGWEIIVDPDLGMSLQLGYDFRYDSDPGDAKRGDLDYFAMLAWTF